MGASQGHVFIFTLPRGLRLFVARERVCSKKPRAMPGGVITAGISNKVEQVTVEIPY
jgi:hypothetical protein